MTYRQLNRSLALIGLCAAMFLGTSTANAQLSVGADLNSVFNSSFNPALLVKYKFAEGRFAGRLGISGNANSNKNNQQFYEDDRYSNLDQWPSEMSKEGSEFSNSTFSITPGIEYHSKVTEKTSIYGAVECGITNSRSESAYNSHSSYLEPNENKYIIVQIFRGSNEADYTAYSPAVRLGVDHQLGYGFSTYGEFGISGTIFQQYSKNDFTRYTWDGVAFNKMPEQDKFKDQDLPWNTNLNWTPTFRLFLAYTFQKADKE